MFKKNCDQRLMSRALMFVSCLVFFVIGMEKQHKKIVATGNFSVGCHVVMGTASVLTDYKVAHKVRKGDIVVMHATDGLCDDMVRLSAGIITERSGKNSHAVFLGKKFNIPVMVGVSEATTKISDGSLILLDCDKKRVYEITKNDECNERIVNSIPKNFYHYIRESHNFYQDSSSSYHWPLSLYHDLGQNCGDMSDIASHISSVPLQSPVSSIQLYVEKVRKDIKEAEKWGKRAAYWVAGISSYAFDSIPFEFFSDDLALNNAFKRFEENFDQLIGYMRELKEKCKKEVLIKTKIDESKLAEILYNQVVDKIDVSDEHRDLLKKEPLQMGELVREGIIKKDQYMDLVLLNIAVRRELEEELKAFQKK